eukprot:352556-Chlamydomonas_euryale.AAC.4
MHSCVPTVIVTHGFVDRIPVADADSALSLVLTYRLAEWGLYGWLRTVRSGVPFVRRPARCLLPCLAALNTGTLCEGPLPVDLTLPLTGRGTEGKDGPTWVIGLQGIRVKHWSHPGQHSLWHPQVYVPPEENTSMITREGQRGSAASQPMAHKYNSLKGRTNNLHMHNVHATLPAVQPRTHRQTSLALPTDDESAHNTTKTNVRGANLARPATNA